jgi:hypothetical protein
MEEALRFFRAYEIWIYGLLALGGLLYLRKFILAWEELRGAAFGLERESAQSRLNQSAAILVFLLVIAVAEFVLVSFVAPSFPGSSPLLTPTVDLFATPTTTLAVSPTVQETLQGTPGQTAAPTQADTGGEGCTPGQVMLTEPQPGAEVTDIIEIKGTANIENFGFYKYEIARPGETIWLTIQAGRQPVQDGDLGQWDTRTLATGEYQLRLVVTDNVGNSLPACVVQVRVNNPAIP